MKRGDTLSRIAADVYGDASRWRVIADLPENAAAAAVPVRPLPGAVLTLPPLDLPRPPRARTP